MKILGIARLLLAALAASSLSFAVGTAHPARHTNSSNALGLQAPPFINVAHAAGEADVLARIDEEAGISAYYKTPDAITISLVRPAFRTIETETADYIIGSVAVPSYVEHYDVHVYVHKTGWILAYYLRGDAVGKMLDMLARTINTTKLKTVVATVASAAGAPFGDVTYYDFRYPSATHMLLVAEDGANGNTFTIKAPSSYGYFDRSWGQLGFNNNGCCFIFDGVGQSLIKYDPYGGGFGYGSLTASQLLPDVTHTIAVGEYVILVIIYRVP